MLPEFLTNPNPQRYLDDSLGYTVADFETTNRDKGSALNRANRIVLGTWLERSVPMQGKVSLRRSRKLYNGVSYKWGDELHQTEIANSLGRTGLLVAHHAKFELQWLLRAGVEISTLLVWDTMLAEYVLAGNRRWDLSLEGTAYRYGLPGKKSLVSKLIESGVCPSEIPKDWLVEYGAEETNLCHQVFLKQREVLAAEGLLPVMFTRCLLTPVLADIEMHGVQLDAEQVKKEHEQSAIDLERSCESLSSSDGGINWNSPQQVAQFLYDRLRFSEIRKGKNPLRTPTGQRLTDAEALGKLRAESKEQALFLETFKEFKKLEKRHQNLEKLLKCIEEDDGRLYAKLNQAVTGTHRLSSSGLRHKVQFQNIDNTIKKLFRARTAGWLIGEADGVQLEFRVAAHLGRDPVALSDIRNPDFDAHWQTAEERTGKSRKDLTKEDRRLAKPYTFRPLYGAMSGNKQERAYIEFFQKRYSAIYDTQTRWTYEVLKEKKLRTETGLIFYWPDTQIEPTRDGRGYIRNRTSIFNYPVQSL